MECTLRITEIFYSLQGESTTVGLPTVFIRLTGCPLRCQYCDTAYAFTGGKKWQLNEILTEVGRYKTTHVTVTGGEPLAQPNCLALLTMLCDQGYHVSLETSGAIALLGVDPRVMMVMDIKTPASNEAHRNLWENLKCLTLEDQIKFVICDQADYEWSKATIVEHQLDKICQVLFSPSHKELAPSQLADWILEDQLPVRFQFQLHKAIWGDVAGK